MTIRPGPSPPGGSGSSVWGGFTKGAVSVHRIPSSPNHHIASSPDSLNTLLHKLTGYHSFTAMVVGDFMLDQQVHGAAERLSPDAPVPVLHATSFENTPGGAANVALCLRGLKGRVLCFGAVGMDQEATLLRG